MSTTTKKRPRKKAAPKAAPLPEPVGAVEIAERLGVRRRTVDEWTGRRRDTVGFPAPRWKVGRRPCWDWNDIAAWATATGRLP